MSGIVVVKPGLFCTVQDGGRPGHAAMGVSACGVADRVAWRMGNALVGNRFDARFDARFHAAAQSAGYAAIECTRLGGVFRFEQDAWVAWTGARSLLDWRAQFVRAGTELACPRISDGARAYLCVRGGIELEPVLGSRSTHVPSALGGLQGRVLRAGDRLAIGADPQTPLPTQRSIEPESIPGYSARAALRIVPGAQTDGFDESVRRQLEDSIWSVAPQSDRMGIRLHGPTLSVPARELLSEGVTLGALQVPPSGQPIVLFVDHQTSGGYPKLACVIQADHARLGQLHPGRRFRLAWVTLDAARTALREQEAALREQEAALREQEATLGSAERAETDARRGSG